MKTVNKKDVELNLDSHNRRRFLRICVLGKNLRLVVNLSVILGR